MADDVEGLELAAELLQGQDGHGEEQPEVVPAVHGGGERVDTYLLAELEGVALEGNLVGVDLGAEAGVAGKPLDGVREAAGDEAPGRGDDLRGLELRDRAGAELGLEVRRDEHAILREGLLALGVIGLAGVEAPAFALQRLHSEECRAERPAHAEQVLGLGRGAPLGCE